MNRLALLTCLVPLTAWALERPDAGTPKDSETPEASETSHHCHEEEVWPAEDDALGALRLRVDGEQRGLAGLELEGLERLSEEEVRALAGVPPGPLEPEQAIAALRRLMRTGLFASVTPTLRLRGSAAPTLRVQLEEAPYVSAVHVEGLHEDDAREVLEALFRVPREHDDDEETVFTLRLGGEQGRLRISEGCPAPKPPRDLFAHVRKRELHPGFVWKGLPEALERAVRELRDEGFLLAELEASLSPEGRLLVQVEEGQVEAVEVRGVDEEVASQVREALGIRPGDVLLRSDLRRATQRVEARLPFLDVRRADSVREPRVRIEEAREKGWRMYRTVPEEPPRRERRRRREELELSWETLSDLWERDADGVAVEGRRVVVTVRPRSPSFDFDFLPVHTQVTGFSPGVSGELTLWDARNRAHLELDAALLVPLRLGGQQLPGAPEQTALQRRLQWLAGAGASVPRLRLAEVGVQGYDFVDTLDRWRLDAFDSYLSSALFNRPDAEYFRRSGLTGFATWRFGPRWLAGVEYRNDRYASLLSLSPPLSLFRRDTAPFPNPPVDEGRMTSVVARLEHWSDVERAGDVGSLFRSPETSLLEHDWEWADEDALRTLLTVEVGSPALGGDAQFRFWKVVSDSVLYAFNHHRDGLRLRLRLAGGRGLPQQKLEALGGWSALRGYGFKELRGDLSALTSTEYRWGLLGVFADVGTVRQEAGWVDPRLGVGATLYLGEWANLTAAWRTDERATAVPDVRMLFAWTF